jgi:PPOX class probable F420-dependent enzyme
MELPQSAKELIGSGPLAHLVTLDADGSPQVTIVWIGLDGEDLVTAHLGAYRKVQNVGRDPRVAISMEGSGANEIGMQHYLVIRGRARVEEGGAPELLQRLAETYIGPGVKFPPMPDPPPGYVLRISPERVGGVGPWASPPGPGG